MTRQETWTPIYNGLVAGHYDGGTDYSSWRSRGTTDWLLILTNGGRGRFGTSTGDLVASTGDVVLLQPGTPHDYGTAIGSANWDILWVHFHPREEWLGLLDWPVYARGTVGFHIAEQQNFQNMSSRFQEMINFSVGALVHREAFCMNALEEILLWLDLENPNASRHTIDSRVQQAMDFMCSHLDETLSISYLSNLFNLSVSRFSHLFRQEIGESPQLFHERKRLERSAQLLSVTDRLVSSIAIEVGYVDPLYFSARFKKRFGISPTLYRTEHHKTNSK
jgi:AraC family transcriptional regulator of arabinose operon